MAALLLHSNSVWVFLHLTHHRHNMTRKVTVNVTVLQQILNFLPPELEENLKENTLQLFQTEETRLFKHCCSCVLRWNHQGAWSDVGLPCTGGAQEPEDIDEERWVPVEKQRGRRRALAPGVEHLQEGALVGSEHGPLRGGEDLATHIELHLLASLLNIPRKQRSFLRTALSRACSPSLSVPLCAQLLCELDLDAHLLQHRFRQRLLRSPGVLLEVRGARLDRAQQLLHLLGALTKLRQQSAELRLRALHGTVGLAQLPLDFLLLLQEHSSSCAHLCSRCAL
mmetsp:Transcript_16468/g.39474  ORF Transcript_16468/g.39474 Transcript_16468/m.39474 type:complete len:282 (-) Transcript_16468:138-983(-)